MAPAARWRKRSWYSPSSSGYVNHSTEQEDGWWKSSGWHNHQDHSTWQEDKSIVRNQQSSSAPETPDLFLPLGIGTWAWGDEKWGYGRADAGYDDGTLRAAFNKALESGVTLFDTSEVYGGSHAETVLGQCLGQTKQKCFVASKWHPRANASVFQKYRKDTVTESMQRTISGSLERLGLDRLDLFQLHSGSNCYGSLEDYADGMAAVVEDGFASYLGVSNVGSKQVRRIHQRLLRTHGIQLFSNQVEFSLLEPGILHDGTLDECQRLGVKILAYCPLAMGRLTGKYSSEPPFHGHGSKSYRYHGAVPWPHINEVLSVCKEIAAKHQATIPQVALNWCIAHGTIPIPGAKTDKQAADNCGTLKWTLDDDDVEKLDAVAATCGR